jgi:hypothetical protein
VKYTTCADAKEQEGSRGRIKWPDGPLEFACDAPNAMLCVELRNMTDLSDTARGSLGKQGRSPSFERLGSV